MLFSACIDLKLHDCINSTAQKGLWTPVQRVKNNQLLFACRQISRVLIYCTLPPLLFVSISVYRPPLLFMGEGTEDVQEAHAPPFHRFLCKLSLFDLHNCPCLLVRGSPVFCECFLPAAIHSQQTRQRASDRGFQWHLYPLFWVCVSVTIVKASCT